MKNILIYTILTVAVQNAFALSAEDILNDKNANSPAEIGRAIAVESKLRNKGFGDSQVAMRMVLKNAQGEESVRTMRNKTFEMIADDVGDKSMMIFDDPRDVKGTTFLTFSKILEPDDQWLYLPALKRVKRISSKNKSGPFMGSEFAYEDISSPEVDKYTYKFLRSEPCPNTKIGTCFVVERTPAYKHSGYTKMIGWMDHAEFRPIKTDFYDRKGELIKTLLQNDYKQYLNKYWRESNMSMVNHQSGKSTNLYFENYQFKTGLKESDFTRAKLKRAR